MKNFLKDFVCFLCVALFCICLASSSNAEIKPSALRQMKTPAGAIWIDSLDMVKLQQTGGPVRPKEAHYGGPLMLGGTIFPHGLGTSSDSFITINLNGAATRFMATVGINDDRSNKKGSVIFQVWLEGKKVAESPVMRGGDKPYQMSVDITGAKLMYLIVDDAGDGPDDDIANWGGALLVLDPNSASKPEAFSASDESASEIAHTDPKQLGIHGPRVVGATPGRPFLFLIPATGDGQLTFNADNLPDGLKLDSKTGIISGSIKKDGETVVTLTVKDSKSVAKRKLKIVGGRHKLALTPPMGWNSWNVWGLAVDAEKVRQAAEYMVKSGLAAHGFQYINIDDGWEAPERAPNGEILTNQKFPDMKKAADSVHELGLKIGIYSSPGPRTCGGYLGSYEHEFQDAASYAKWGIDYLKYDWCSYGGISKGNTLDELQKPYKLMREALDSVDRDIVYSLCQYGMGKVWEWGKDVGGNLWRTTGDIVDTWGSMSSIAFGQNGHESGASPGHWNDPDMLVVGKVGWGPTLHQTRLTRNEQITHITFWSMLAAPLLIGCDMSQLDQFTIDLLTNDDVLDVNQDPLGKQARRIAKDGMNEVWARPLYDGTVAVAFFNRFFEKANVTVNWAELGISGKQPVRNLWQKKDLGDFDGSYTATVPVHGAVMVKIGKPNTTD